MTEDTRTIEEIFTQEVIDAALETHWRGTSNWCTICGHSRGGM